ncbi:MAG: uroporphyrinogen-III synthase, partial [Rubrivivax sp.]
MLTLVTRPEPQATEWAQALQQQGEQALALPLIEIGPPHDTGAVASAWQTLPQFRLVMFVSPNAAAWFARLRPEDAVWPPTTRAAAPGPGTARALADALGPAGLKSTQVLSPPGDSEQFDSEHLWPLLAPLPWAGHQVLIVSGGDAGQARGRQWLSDRLREAGATIGTVLAYERQCARWTQAQHALATSAYARPAQHAWLLSSSEAVAHLIALQGPLPEGARAIVTHPRVAETARLAGFRHVALARPLPDAV